VRSAYQIEQVFVRRRGGHIEISLVLVALSGATKRERLLLPTQDERQALVMTAENLARRPDVDGAAGARLRVATTGKLKDDPELLELFQRAFEART
jgi:hypothetical protein